MKVLKIQEYIAKYKNYRSQNKDFDQSYKWEVQCHFNNHWNIESKDICSMYTKSFSSTKSGHLWNGELDSPKSMMLKMMDVAPDFVKSMFRDLFSEDKELLLRLDRFGFHCDQIIPKVTSKYGKVVDHYHHNYKILSLYMALKFPAKYCIFDFEPFYNTMIKLELNTLPQSFEIIRFFKLIKAINNFLIKDKELLDMHQKQIPVKWHYNRENLLLAHDFYWTCGSPEYQIDNY